MGMVTRTGMVTTITTTTSSVADIAMADPQVQQQMITSGFEPVLDSGPEPAQQEVASELARWTPIIKTTGFKVQ